MRSHELTPIAKPKLLIGEGKDEARLFGALLKHAHLTEEIQMLSYDGKSKLGEFLRALPKLPGFNRMVSLGVTRDADSDSAKASESTAGLIQNAGFPAEVKVRVLILPDGKRSGAIEDILCEALASRPEWTCVEQLVACRSAIRGDWPNHIANLGKAKVEAWLSTQDQPTIRLGEAAEAGLIPFDAQAFAPLLAFIRSL